MTARTRPITVSEHEARALANGARLLVRPVKHEAMPDPGHAWRECVCAEIDPSDTPCVVCEARFGESPFGAPGDVIACREAWADVNTESGPAIAYRAGGYRFCQDDAYPVEYERYPGCTFTMWCGDLRRGEPGHAWRLSTQMPAWAIRQLYPVKSVRVVQLGSVDSGTAMATGVDKSDLWTPKELDSRPFEEKWWDDHEFWQRYPRMVFERQWQRDHGKRYPWSETRWVWVGEVDR